MKKAKIEKKCPDCGKILAEKEIVYGTYRDRYKDKNHPEGKMFVCKDCYKG